MKKYLLALLVLVSVPVFAQTCEEELTAAEAEIVTLNNDVANKDFIIYVQGVQITDLQADVATERETALQDVEAGIEELRQ